MAQRDRLAAGETVTIETYEKRSGERGIRTPGTLAGSADFKSAAIDQTLPSLQVILFLHGKSDLAAIVPYIRYMPRFE